MDFAPHEERLIYEHHELTERHNKLKAFFQTPSFTVLKEAEATRLLRQSFFMAGYVDVLAERIDAMIRARAIAQDEGWETEATRWRWLVRHARLGFESAPSWNAAIRLPVFDSADQTITALVDSARNAVGEA
jgi:hypothetical protein